MIKYKTAIIHSVGGFSNSDKFFFKWNFYLFLVFYQDFVVKSNIFYQNILGQNEISPRRTKRPILSYIDTVNDSQHEYC